MANFLNNLKLYEEGVTDGIEQGQQFLLLELLHKKLGHISEKYLDRIEYLDKVSIINIALSIFDINRIEDLDKFFS